MAIPKIRKEDVIAALKYIDENGVPSHHGIMQYELVTDDGKRYPPKYVVAMADHLVNGAEISTDDFNSITARNLLKGLGFQIEKKQPGNFELTIRAEGITSTDARFTMDNLFLGDKYLPVDAYFESTSGGVIRRRYNKGEQKISNVLLPRLAFQVFEDQLAELTDEEKKSFPICQYKPDKKVYRGIYASEAEFKEWLNSIECMTYKRKDGGEFVIYCWNIFSTIIFVRECLKRFGEPGDQFILRYKEKDEGTETEEAEAPEELPEEAPAQEEPVQPVRGYRNPYSAMLLGSKNLIFRGAPGTGKSYLARQIAADIITNGITTHFAELTDEQKKQVEFVQFHPSYDYSDFVEGLRPKINDDGTMGFELRDGIFKKFVARARKNWEDAQKPREIIEKELSVQESMEAFFSELQPGVDTFKTITGNAFTITDVDDAHIYISIPGNSTTNRLTLSRDEVRRMLESGRSFVKVKDVVTFFGKAYAQSYSYELIICNKIKDRKSTAPRAAARPEALKKYIFIIDEINRGEISKIFGELFFAIDPGYRGKAGEIATQYANLHEDQKFYVPENVYIIGTMNDIDRSVDSFDFAMRRRFRFVEIRADERLEMLDALGNEALKNEAIARMAALNRAIAGVEDLNENYQIGAAYFLKLKTLNFDRLWTDYLRPLLQEYVRGMYGEQEIMKKFAGAYGYREPTEGNADGTIEDQG